MLSQRDIDILELQADAYVMKLMEDFNKIMLGDRANYLPEEGQNGQTVSAGSPGIQVRVPAEENNYSQEE